MGMDRMIQDNLEAQDYNEFKNQYYTQFSYLYPDYKIVNLPHTEEALVDTISDLRGREAQLNKRISQETRLKETFKNKYIDVKQRIESLEKEIESLKLKIEDLQNFSRFDAMIF